MNGFLLCSVLFVGQYATGGGESQWLIDFPVDGKPAPIKLNTSKPYVVFANVDQVDVAGIQSIRDDSYNAKGVFIVMPNGQWHRVLDRSDIAGEVRRLEGQVSRPASFFGKSERPIAGRDDSEKVSGRWPSMARLEGMERYKPFQLTQSIFKYVGNPNGIIRGVHRSATEAKYQVPGGLIGVTGWRSELYRSLPSLPVERPAMIGVKNSFGHYQSEAAFLRSYADDSEFDDVLVNTVTNKVFEHRVAQKIDGKWERFVAYRNLDEAPQGYVPPRSKDCRACHQDAASGGYGVGLAPGSDEVFSDPFRDFPQAGEERQIPLR